MNQRLSSETLHATMYAKDGRAVLQRAIGRKSALALRCSTAASTGERARLSSILVCQLVASAPPNKRQIRVAIGIVERDRVDDVPLCLVVDWRRYRTDPDDGRGGILGKNSFGELDASTSALAKVEFALDLSDGPCIVRLAALVTGSGAGNRPSSTP